MIDFSDSKIKRLIELAIEEDVHTGDVTTNAIIVADKTTSARIVAKEKGIIAGLEIARMVFQYFDDQLIWKATVDDGKSVRKDSVIAELTGNYRAILTAERTALNFLQRMSGIATKTNTFVQALQGKSTQILDTRKTIPGHRLLDKYAVKMGGGTNHRFGLYDMVLIKDNHIKIAGSITEAVKQVRRQVFNRYKIEVEVTSVEEAKEALDAKADFIMFDNMSLNEMKESVKLINKKAKTEASGNVTLDKLKKIAECQVDFISIGELTHSVKALDISLNIVK